MKKLAFIINVFREETHFHSGGEKLFYELVKKALEEGFTVDLYCTTYLGSKTELKEKINKIKFFGHPKDFKYPDKIENFYENVKKEIDKENYDFVISENISPPIDIGILQGHSHKHYRDLSGNFIGQVLYWLKKSGFIKYQEKWLKTSYRKIVVPSETLKNELVRNFNIDENKFIVMYPGVDKPDNKACEKKNEIFTFGISAPSFGKKGGFIFLEALSILKKAGYKFRAKIIYPKAKTNIALQACLKLYDLKSYVEFLPYQENIQEFYESIDCLVMPSLLETFGLVALEAMINKKPAIVSSFSGASEIIKDSENGFVFDMNGKSHKNLAFKMAYLLDYKDRYDEIAGNAYETALKQDWKNFSNRFIQELEKLEELDKR